MDFTESLVRNTHRISFMLYSSWTKILCPLCVNRIARLEVTKIKSLFTKTYDLIGDTIYFIRFRF